MPCKFFERRCKDKQKPYGKDTRGECVMTCDDKLGRTIAKEQRYCHGTQNTCRHQQASREVIGPLVGRQIQEPTQEILSQSATPKNQHEG